MQTFTLTITRRPTSPAPRRRRSPRSPRYVHRDHDRVPVPTLARGGAAADGVTSIDNGDGTGTLGGTPAAGTGGAYALAFSASNGIGANGRRTSH